MYRLEFPPVTAFVVLLRAVNVGGTGKLPMADLRRLCDSAGFPGARTYIASGNVLVDSERPEAAVKADLEKALEAYAGRPVGVVVRTAAEMAAVVAGNPFPDAPGNRAVAIFLAKAPPPDLHARVTGRRGEEIGLGAREIYVRYPDGLAQSKLRIPDASAGTARNMNTVARLAALAAGDFG